MAVEMRRAKRNMIEEEAAEEGDFMVKGEQINCTGCTKRE